MRSPLLQSRVPAEASLTRLDVSIGYRDATDATRRGNKPVRAAERTCNGGRSFSSRFTWLVDNPFVLAQTRRSRCRLARARVNLAKRRQQIISPPFSPTSGYRGFAGLNSEGGLLAAVPVQSPSALRSQSFPQRRRSSKRRERNLSAYSGSLLLSKVLFAVLSTYASGLENINPAVKLLGGAKDLGADRSNGPREYGDVSRLRHLHNPSRKAVEAR